MTDEIAYPPPETERLSAEWAEPEQFLGPKLKRITFQCAACDHIWSRTYKAEPKKDPPCPNKRCADQAEIVDLKRQMANLTAMLESGQAPPTVGANARVRAIDVTADIVMQDNKLTNLKDNIRMGETMAPKLPPEQQKRADNLFAAAGGSVPVIGRSQVRNSVPSKWLQHIGARAIAGSYRQGAVSPMAVIPKQRPPVVRVNNEGYDSSRPTAQGYRQR